MPNLILLVIVPRGWASTSALVDSRGNLTASLARRWQPQRMQQRLR